MDVHQVISRCSNVVSWYLVTIKCVKSIEHHFEVVSRDAPHQFHRIVCRLDHKQQKGRETKNKAAAGPAPPFILASSQRSTAHPPRAHSKERNRPPAS